MTRRALLVISAIGLCAANAYAVDLGKAQGTVTVDGARVDLTYAYAINHQKNEITNRKDDTRVVLTDKPLPDGIDLGDIDNTFPDGTLGVIFCLTHEDKVSHILVQHAKGMYDAGYFDGDDHYTFKRLKTERGSIAGNVSSRKVKTATMAFTFDAEFNAPVK